jgi:hypothetical protein
MANASWGKRPTSKATTAVPSVDQFVKGTSETVRLNVLIPSDLHKRVKSACAIEGVSMTEVVVEFLEQRFPKG